MLPQIAVILEYAYLKNEEINYHFICTSTSSIILYINVSMDIYMLYLLRRDIYIYYIIFVKICVDECKIEMHASKCLLNLDIYILFYVITKKKLNIIS